MRPFMFFVVFAVLIGLGSWAYRENYATQRALDEVELLQSQIADLREALALQRAEWAYLNRPDRLRELAAINFDRLGLLPLEPSQFGTPEQVAMPPSGRLPLINDPVDVIGMQQDFP
jgi:hypothetical protein